MPEMLHAALQRHPVILFEYTFLLNMEKEIQEATRSLSQKPK
jgi:hypothetical protein